MRSWYDQRRHNMSSVLSDDTKQSSGLQVEAIRQALSYHQDENENPVKDELLNWQDRKHLDH